MSGELAANLEPERHPMDELLRADRLPHIWCPGCGLGTALHCFLSALKKSNLDLDKVAVVSGIGCTGRVAGYVKLDSFHTTHGRAIPFATGLKLANPELKVVVFSGDGDLIAIGGNHLIHAARRNLDMTIICVNNFNYGMTGGQVGPTTPLEARTTTSPYGNFEHPFNLPYLAAASGAVYVARWTTLHARRLERAIEEALNKRGFSFVEIISPCPVGYGRRQEKRQREGLDTMHYYREKTVIRHGIDPKEAEITLDGEIIVGKFVDIEKPTFSDLCDQVVEKVVGGSAGVQGCRGGGEKAPLHPSTPAPMLRMHPGTSAPLLRKVGRTEIRLTGLGGQGIIRAGYILGKAAAIHDGRNAVFTQSYGPEARGGASSAQVIISDEPIRYPRLIAPSVLIAMSQEGWDRYHGELREDSLAIIEEELVEPGSLAKGVKLLSIPATRIAEGLGRSIVANVVMLGFVAAVTDVVSVEALREAVRTSVPRGTEELNLRAFEQGYRYGLGVKGNPNVQEG